jgi:ABC-type transporter Mla maintaining outer membrane lipid asymmetry ATPase subunit MlaF
MTAAPRPSNPRASYLVDAFAMGVEGAAPLVFRDVDVREHPDHPASRFTLAVEPGQVVLCLGDEDSGVGDLGRFVLGLDRPPAGRVLVFGTDIAELEYDEQLVFRRRLGYAQAGDGLLQNQSLRGNIALPLQYASDHRLDEVAGRIDRLVAAFELGDAADRRPAQANEEDRRRAAVARAIALDPELLVMEAPFDGLTGRAARFLLERALHREDGTPRSIFITAQDVTPAVGPMITRTVLLVDGVAVEGK